MLTEIMTVKFVAITLIAVAWAWVVWKKWWMSAAVLVAPGEVMFVIILGAFLGSLISFGLVDPAKLAGRVIREIFKEAIVVVSLFVATLVVGIGLFML